MAKDYYHDLLLPELIRYAKLQKMDPEKLDEFGAAIYSVWYTQNPLGKPDRDSICNFGEPEQEAIVFDKKSALEAFGNPRPGETPKPRRRPPKLKGVRFTAHTHPNEPLEPSPDDFVVYGQLRKQHKDDPSDLFHFIIDGFSCRRVEDKEEIEV
ncbi:MAG: hypothetical protein ACI4V1_01200 [Eubacteriales bacterium]